MNMKVRHSNIPVSNGKPQYPNRKPEPANSPFSDDDDKDEEDDDDKEAKYIKTMVVFKGLGLTMGLFSIESIETGMQFVEKPKAHWEYGIMINHAMEPSIRFPKTNVSVWFENEEVRDKRYADMLETLESFGFNMLEV